MAPLGSLDVSPTMTPAVPELDEGLGLVELGFGVVVPVLGVAPGELPIPGIAAPFIGVVDEDAPGEHHQTGRGGEACGSPQTDA